MHNCFTLTVSLFLDFETRESADGCLMALSCHTVTFTGALHLTRPKANALAKTAGGIVIASGSLKGRLAILELENILVAMKQ